MSLFAPGIIIFTALAILLWRTVASDTPTVLVWAGVAIVIAIGLTLVNFTGSISGFKFSPLSNYAGVLVLVAQLGVLGYSYPYLETHKLNYSEWSFFVLSLTVGLLAVVYTENLFVFLVGAELVSVAFYFLCLYKPGNHTVEAGLKFYLFNLIGSAVVLLGIVLFYLATHSAGLAALTGAQSPVVTFSVLIVVTGVAIKLGLGPFYFWLPDVLEGIPLPLFALLSTSYQIALISFLLRVMLYLRPGIPVAWIYLFLFFTIISLLVGSLFTFAQNYFKRLLAWTVVFRSGFVTLGLATGTLPGARAVLFYLTVSTSAFMGVAGLLQLIKSESEEKIAIATISSLPSANKLISFSGGILFLSLAGFPPLAGFAAKTIVCLAGIGANFFVFTGLALVSLLIVVSCYFRLLSPLLFSEKNEAGELKMDEKKYWSNKAVLFTAAGVVLVLGFLPNLIYDYLILVIS